MEELKDILREANLSFHTYFLFVLKLQEEETYHGQDLETAEARALLEILDLQYECLQSADSVDKSSSLLYYCEPDL